MEYLLFNIGLRPHIVSLRPHIVFIHTAFIGTHIPMEEAQGSSKQVIDEHKNRVRQLCNSLQKNWDWNSLGTANADSLNRVNIWHRFYPMNNQNSYLWANARRCLAEILTGLTCEAMLNDQGQHQIIQRRITADPFGAVGVNTNVIPETNAGQIRIINQNPGNGSINIVIPIGLNIGDSTQLVLGPGIGDHLPNAHQPVQYIEIYVKVRDGKVTIVSIFPCGFSEYNQAIQGGGAANAFKQ